MFNAHLVNFCSSYQKDPLETMTNLINFSSFIVTAGINPSGHLGVLDDADKRKHFIHHKLNRILLTQVLKPTCKPFQKRERKYANRTI